jgi:hypothetical protein
LTDTIFYGFFASFGLTGLLVLTAVLSICSFVIIPSILMRRNAVPTGIMLAVITLAVCASSFRLWVRPEALSFLFLSVLILVNDIAQTTINRKKILLCSALIFSIMALWANCHVLFVIGLTYLAGYYLLAILQSIWLEKSVGHIGTGSTILTAAVLGTLCTPWHFQFWLYTYKLLGSPVTHGNKENGPMTLSDLSNPTFIPLCLLLVLVWGVSLAKNYRQKESFIRKLLPLTLLFCSTLVIIVFRRMTPLALLIIFAALSKTFQNGSADRSCRWHNMLISLGVTGCICYFTATYFVSPCLPAVSRLFHPPYNAIAYLKLHIPVGRLLNDSKFGGMMEWNLKNLPDIFIDGRFSSFDRQLVYDYNAMRLCQGNWQQLLQKYKICWLFFSPETPIIVRLSKTTDWQTAYADESAVVLCRSSPNP